MTTPLPRLSCWREAPAVMSKIVWLATEAGAIGPHDIAADHSRTGRNTGRMGSPSAPCYVHGPSSVMAITTPSARLDADVTKLWLGRLSGGGAPYYGTIAPAPSKAKRQRQNRRKPATQSSRGYRA